MEGGVTPEEPPKPKTAAELFDEAFPHYLAMGMSEEQFWDRDCLLVIPYRKAYQIRQEEANNNAWLQGVYIMQALQSVPVFVNGFMPRGARLQKYFDKPIDFTPVRKKKTVQETNTEKKNNAISFMEKLAGRFNSQFDRKAQEDKLHGVTEEPKPETIPESIQETIQEDPPGKE